MGERPILFSAEMVRAILAGRKTQTRRVVKPQPFEVHGHVGGRRELHDGTPVQPEHLGVNRCIWTKTGWAYDVAYNPETDARACTCTEVRCPYGAPGDRLWVREAWTFVNMTEDKVCIAYPADGPDLPNRPMIKVGPDVIERLWAGRDPWMHRSRPSIHMPRWASRLTLEVTNVRVERVHEITEEDAQAEGCEEYAFTEQGRVGMVIPARDDFAALWDRINAKRGFGWGANPWVWAISFRVVAPAEVAA